MRESFQNFEFFQNYTPPCGGTPQKVCRGYSQGPEGDPCQVWFGFFWCLKPWIFLKEWRTFLVSIGKAQHTQLWCLWIRILREFDEKSEKEAEKEKTANSEKKAEKEKNANKNWVQEVSKYFLCIKFLHKIPIKFKIAKIATKIFEICQKIASRQANLALITWPRGCQNRQLGNRSPFLVTLAV